MWFNASNSASVVDVVIFCLLVKILMENIRQSYLFAIAGGVNSSISEFVEGLAAALATCHHHLGNIERQELLFEHVGGMDMRSRHELFLLVFLGVTVLNFRFRSCLQR